MCGQNSDGEGLGSMKLQLWVLCGDNDEHDLGGDLIIRLQMDFKAVLLLMNMVILNHVIAVVFWAACIENDDCW